MAGRRPRVIPDNEISRKTKQHAEDIEKNTPKYMSQEFIAPPSLTEKEKEVWDWLVEIFRETVGCRVSDADVHLMELYCRAKVAADEADAELKKDPRPYILVVLGKDKDGVAKTTAKPNPNLKKRKENMELCLKFFDQLGLTPLARARAGIKGANADTEKSLFEILNERSDD